MHGSIKNIRKNLDQLKFLIVILKMILDYMINLGNLVGLNTLMFKLNMIFVSYKVLIMKMILFLVLILKMIAEEVALGGKYNCSENNTSGIGFSVDVRYLLKNQPVEKKLINKSGKWIIEVTNE